MTSDEIAEHAVVHGGRRWRIFLTYVMPPLIAITIVLVPTLSSAAILPRLGVTPGFALIDQNEEALTSEGLRGDIAVFGLATLDCPDSCRSTLAALRTVRERWSESEHEPEEMRLRLVVIMVDAVENPGTLREFVADHGLADEEWSIVSGSEAAVRAVVAFGFGVQFGRSDAGEVIHDPGLFLSDHAGFLRAEYRAGVPNPRIVSDDIDRIVSEANAGTVRGLFYNAAHSLSLSCGA